MAILLGTILSAIGVAAFYGTLGSSLDGRRDRARPDARLLVLLRLRRRERDRDDRPQPGLGDDDAHDHHLVGHPPEVRRLRDDGDVLRDGARRHGLHGALDLRPDDHGPEDRLLARLDARGAGKGEVLGRDRGVDRRRPDDRHAREGLPVRRGRAGRHARGPRGAAGLDHEGARRDVHEPAADRVLPLRDRRRDRDHHGDAAGAGADLRARDVPAARAEHAGARGRHHLVLTSPKKSEKAGGDGGAHDARARRRHRVGPHGRAARSAASSAPRCGSSRGTARTSSRRPSTATRPSRRASRSSFFVGLCLYLWIDSTRKVGEN